MILYLDTSDLFKLYVSEDDSPRVRSNAAGASRLASSRFAYVEMHSALSRAYRNGRLSQIDAPVDQQGYERLVRQFRRDWRFYVKSSLSQPLLETASDLAAKHGLRAGDAVHLASAMILRDSALDEVRISVADSHLRTGAVSEGFVVV